MKNLLLSIFLCLFSINAVAESPPPNWLDAPTKWVRIVRSSSGNIQFLDINKIKQEAGYVYFFNLLNLAKADKDGDLSYISYRQGDCRSFRVKGLGYSFHKKRNGAGKQRLDRRVDKNWKYPRPKSSDGLMLKFVCDYVK